MKYVKHISFLVPCTRLSPNISWTNEQTYKNINTFPYIKLSFVRHTSLLHRSSYDKPAYSMHYYTTDLKCETVMAWQGTFNVSMLWLLQQ